MSAVLPLAGGATRDALWDGPIVDADVHAVVPSPAALEPYLDPVWTAMARERGFVGPVGGRVGTYPPGMPSSSRPEWRPGDERPPASELELLTEHVLDPWRVERALLVCSYGVDSLRYPDWAAALASAVNDWLVEHWLERDARLRATLVVPGRDPAAIVAEIERIGGHPGFVQVLLPVRSERLYGKRSWWPVYEALVRHDLVMGLHWGGTSDSAPTPSGWPSWYAEEYVGEIALYQAQIVSMIAEGVFAAVADLRVSVLEAGFAWLPGVLWRLDKEWKGLRRDIPWVTEPPSELVRRHMRFSVAPLDAGPPEAMRRIVEWLGDDDLLMFATDYPHFHDDDFTVLLDALPDERRAALMAGTARSWYRL